MLRTVTRFSLVGMTLVVGATTASAQGARFSPGAGVEVHSYSFYPPWQKAIVSSVGGKNCSNPDKPYEVHFGGKEAGLDRCVGADEIRAVASEQPLPGSDHSPKPGTSRGASAVGDRVDVYLSGNTEGKNRGTITAIDGGLYKVHFDGCPETGAFGNELVDRSQVRPAAAISADAPDIKFLTGKWVMFTPSYPTTVVRGDSIYREYGTGATAPPLQISADGTYVWYFDFGKPPVKGRWTPHAKIEGTRYGTETENGIIIKDPRGGQWKVYRRKSTLDRDDHLTARTMCSGQTIMGSRVP